MVTDMSMRSKMQRSMIHSGVKQVDGHPRFGYHTMLNTDSSVPLPTAPPVVGGNTDWTKRKVSPATSFLHNFLASKRSMNPSPAVGSDLKLREPNVNSIHTTI
jgi:hypothetical protein